MKITIKFENLKCPHCGYPMQSVHVTGRSRCVTDGCEIKGKWFYTPTTEVEMVEVPAIHPAFKTEANHAKAA